MSSVASRIRSLRRSHTGTAAFIVRSPGALGAPGSLGTGFRGASFKGRVDASAVRACDFGLLDGRRVHRQANGKTFATQRLDPEDLRLLEHEATNVGIVVQIL